MGLPFQACWPWGTSQDRPVGQRSVCIKVESTTCPAKEQTSDSAIFMLFPKCRIQCAWRPSYVCFIETWCLGHIPGDRELLRMARNCIAAGYFQLLRNWLHSNHTKNRLLGPHRPGCVFVPCCVQTCWHSLPWLEHDCYKNNLVQRSDIAWSSLYLRCQRWLVTHACSTKT